MSCPAAVVAAAESHMCAAQTAKAKTQQNRVDTCHTGGRTRQHLSGQGWGKFHRAVQGLTRQGRAGPCRAGQRWAKLSWAGLGSLWVTALSDFTGPGALVSHKQLHIRARPGVPIQSRHMGGFNQSHIHHASRHLQACSQHLQW